jgi:hypothetical protein
LLSGALHSAGHLQKNQNFKLLGVAFFKEIWFLSFLNQSITITVVGSGHCVEFVWLRQRHLTFVNATLFKKTQIW